jgi:hypothetical protein
MQQLIILLFILIIIAYASVKIRDDRLLRTVTTPYRGNRAERRLVVRLLKYGMSPQRIFHDLYLRKKNSGTFSQIDIVAITTVGIVVFEVKDYSGWIFGKGYQKKWTQVLAYGKEKHRFYNPVMQNASHIDALRKATELLDNVPIYSVIVFDGNCVLRDVSFIPNATAVVKLSNLSKIMRHIEADNDQIAYNHEEGIIRVLREAVINGENKDIRSQHIRNVQNRFSH